MILHAESFRNKDKVHRAKRGLRLFLTILFITSIILNLVVMITKSIPLIVVYMFTPAFSSILTRIILREGFKDMEGDWFGTVNTYDHLWNYLFYSLV